MIVWRLLWKQPGSCQSNSGITDLSFHSFCIKGQILKMKHFAIIGAGGFLKASQYRFNPHQQLLIVKWLCDVIICAVSYEVHFAVYICFSGNTDNRNVHHSIYLVQYDLARYAGKHQIK